jgi:hypothetical protein
MKTAFTIIAAIIVPGGLIFLAIGIATLVIARRRASAKAAQPMLAAA